MTRFSRRAVLTFSGLAVCATIWASVGISQESTPGSGANLSRAGGLPPGAATPPVAEGSATPGKVPPRVDPGWVAEPGLRHQGETVLEAAERADRQGAAPGDPAATNVSGFIMLDASSIQRAVAGETSSLRVIPAEGVNASSLKEIVETLIPTVRGQVAVDATTNSLIVRVPDVTFDEIKKLVANLQEVKRAGPKVNEPEKGREPRGGSGSSSGSGLGAGLEGVGDVGAFSGMSRGGGGKLLGEPVVAPQVSLAELKRDYERADKAARDFAATMKSNVNRNDDSMASLQNRVAYAFSLRQTFLRVELAEMQRRMAAIQDSIDLRDRAAKQIIERRVSDLLDPNLRWEPESTPSVGASGFIDANGVQWPRPLGLPGGMRPGGASAEGSSSNGKASFTSEPVPPSSSATSDPLRAPVQDPKPNPASQPESSIRKY